MKKKAIHMKFLNHSIGFCLLLTLLCYSCASDYLDTAPTSEVSPAELFRMKRTLPMLSADWRS